MPASTPWSDPRSGGIDLLTLSFSEPIDPATAIPANIAVTAYAADGSEVDLDLDDREFDLRLGNQYADLRFTPPLPENLRYCIRVVNVKDLAGNTLAGDSARVDLTALPGDLTNDLRVTVNDGGALATLLGTSPIDPLNPYHVRADINRDGSVTMSDMAILLTQVGTDLRFVPTTCIDVGSEDPSEPFKKAKPEPTATEGPIAVADGNGPQGGAQAATAGPSGGEAGAAGTAASAPIVLGRVGDRLERGLLRRDLLAVRAMPRPEPEVVDDEADDGSDGTLEPVDPEVVAAIYGLVTLEPGDAEARDGQAGGSCACRNPSAWLRRWRRWPTCCAPRGLRSRR